MIQWKEIVTFIRKALDTARKLSDPNPREVPNGKYEDLCGKSKQQGPRRALIIEPISYAAWLEVKGACRGKRHSRRQGYNSC